MNRGTEPRKSSSITKYIVYAVLVVLVTMGISYMSSVNDVRKRKYPASLIEQVRKCVNDCAQNAITSSKIGNPVLAYTYAIKSAECINTLRTLIGDDDLFEMTELNIADVADMIRKHQRNALDQLLQYVPGFITQDVWNSSLIEQLDQEEMMDAQPQEQQEQGDEADEEEAERPNLSIDVNG